MCALTCAHGTCKMSSELEGLFLLATADITHTRTCNHTCQHWKLRKRNTSAIPFGERRRRLRLTVGVQGSWILALLYPHERPCEHQFCMSLKSYFVPQSSWNFWLLRCFLSFSLSLSMLQMRCQKGSKYPRKNPSRTIQNNVRKTSMVSIRPPHRFYRAWPAPKKGRTADG